MVAKSDPNSIQLLEERGEAGATNYVLKIDSGRRATLVHRPGKDLRLDLEIIGDFSWAETKVFVLGLAKLTELGERLSGNATDVEQLLHTPTKEEIDMANKASAVRKKKVEKKTGKTSAPRETASAMFQELIMDGSKTDDQIFAAVQKKFGLDDDKRSYVAWYRNKLKKDGKKVPAQKE